MLMQQLLYVAHSQAAAFLLHSGISAAPTHFAELFLCHLQDLAMCEFWFLLCAANKQLAAHSIVSSKVPRDI